MSQDVGEGAAVIIAGACMWALLNRSEVFMRWKYPVSSRGIKSHVTPPLNYKTRRRGNLGPWRKYSVTIYDSEYSFLKSSSEY